MGRRVWWWARTVDVGTADDALDGNDALTWDDLLNQGSCNRAATAPEHGVSVALGEAVVGDGHHDDYRGHHAATYGWVVCGCGQRCPNGNAYRYHQWIAHRRRVE